MFYKLKERTTLDYFNGSYGNDSSEDIKESTKGLIINLDKIVYIEEIEDELDEKTWNLHFGKNSYIPVSSTDWKEIKRLLNI